jgi:antibiotic biosynthesis monooxygenase (ABM) superfamily enzyme
MPTMNSTASRIRLALVMLAAVYPLVTALLYALAPLTDGWATWQRTLVLAPLMVASIVFYIAPAIQRNLGWFVAGRPHAAA